MEKLLVANWKMNPATIAEAEVLFNATVKAAEGIVGRVVVCPPFDYLLPLMSERGSVALGAQDLFWENVGPYTGEISPTMLRGAGMEYVIVGHSERRHWLKETDEMVNKKVIAALNAGLIVIMCVGEPKEVREKGLEAATQFVRMQLEQDLIGVVNDHVSNLIVAYEPIWAIGGVQADKPEESATMANAIKAFASEQFGQSVRVLYGGSVNAANVKEFLDRAEIDGALVGGASLKSEEFGSMIQTIK